MAVHCSSEICCWISPFFMFFHRLVTVGNSYQRRTNDQSIIPSTDMIQLTLTLKMTTAQVVETSVTVNNNSPIQDYVHPVNQTQPTFHLALLY